MADHANSVVNNDMNCIIDMNDYFHLMQAYLSASYDYPFFY